MHHNKFELQAKRLVCYLQGHGHSKNITVAIVFIELLTPQWGAADAKIKVSSVENTELKGSPLKPGAGQYIAIRATLTASDFFLANFYLSGPFTRIFSKTSPEFFLC